MKKLPINELLRLACYYAEQDRETYLDCIKDAGNQKDIDDTKQLIKQLREYRHKRWGKFRIEQLMAEAKPCALADIKQEASSFDMQMEKPKGKTLVEVFAKEAKALTEQQADLLLKIYNHPCHAIVGIEEFSDHFKPLVEKGMLDEEDVDEGYIKLHVTVKGKDYIDRYLHKSDAQTEGWINVLREGKPKGENSFNEGWAKTIQKL